MYKSVNIKTKQTKLHLLNLCKFLDFLFQSFFSYSTPLIPNYSLLEEILLKFGMSTAATLQENISNILTLRHNGNG